LFFATDPVALDIVGWNVIDAKRAALGWAPVASMGSANWTPTDALRTRLSVLGAGSQAEALALSFTGQNRLDGQASDAFDRRQPAGAAGADAGLADLFLLVDDDARRHHDEEALHLAAVAGVLEEPVQVRDLAQHRRAELIAALRQPLQPAHHHRTAVGHRHGR